ncbi:MAG: adenylate/guanylate cyclase domain-containing protein [Deltaproteobacteria bacterium]|nr:adenylate/guanylate cyclase domain-containing protein [Deltaproteobacteria bacterium]
MKLLRHPLFVGALLGLLLAGLAALQRTRRLGAVGEWIEQLEARSLDLRFVLRGPVSTGDEVVILAYDDRTLQQAPELYEHRDGWAKMLDALAASRVRVIGLDAFFPDPERLLPDELRADISCYFRETPAGEGPARELLSRVDFELRADERLVQAVQRAGNVILAFHLGRGQRGEMRDPALAKARYGQSISGARAVPDSLRFRASMPELNAAASALGVATVMEDGTGLLRKLVMVRRHGRGYYAPLSLQLVAAHQGLGKARLAFLGMGPEPELRFGPSALTLDEDLSMVLNYRGPSGSFPTYSIVDLVAGRIPPEALEGKIALVGVTFFGHDRTTTSTDEDYPGVEVHATAVDNLLRGDPLQRPPWTLDLLVCLLLGLLVCLPYWPVFSLGPLAQSGATLVVLLTYLGACQVLFGVSLLWMPVLWPVIVVMVVGTACLLLRYLAEGLQRRRLRHAFAHYLSPDVIEQLLEKPGALRLGGERRELTVLFSDIRSFTTLSEGLPPETLTSLLNAYLTPMTDVVLEHRGMLDKYIGDAIMALFGAPVPIPDHAAAACRAALEMLRRLADLDAEWQARGWPRLRIGIGVNTGPMSVGNMGSAERFDYTAVGDEVNLASRLEGLNKVFGSRVIVGQATREAAGDAFSFRELDRVAVKGKQEAKRIYELLHEGPPGPEDGWVADFERALQAYRAGSWAEALAVFERLAREQPDPPSAVFADRCRQMAAEPSADWDGVWRMLSK